MTEYPYPDGLEPRVQPQNIDSEEAVLGACMISSDVVHEVLSILPSELDVFYKESHRAVYKALIELYRASEPIDLITMTSQLRKNGDLEKVGGAYGLTVLTHTISSDAHVIKHAHLILEAYFARIIIKANSISIDKLYASQDPFEVIDREYAKLEYIMGILDRKDAKSLPVIVDENLQAAKDAMTLPDHITGVTTGFNEFNLVTAGLQKSDLIILAARPGMGKTAFAIAMMKAMANDGHHVAFFSLEMSQRQIVNRMMAAEAELSLERITSGRIQQYEYEMLKEKSERIKRLPIHVYDQPAMTVLEIKAKCSQLNKQVGLSAVFIDYLQLMSGDGKNREQEISAISRGLKGLAKELDIPVIALSQLSRAVEQRGGAKRPQLSDLRESGSIEQDADIVGFLYRAEYYGITEFGEGNMAGQPTMGMAELNIAKNRQGRLVNFFMRFHEKFVKFSDLEHDHMEVSQTNKDLHKQYKGKSVDPEQNKEDDLGEMDWLET